MKIDQTYDARGLICPIPILRARKILMALEAGQYLAIHVSDLSSEQDFKDFCADQGHLLYQQIEHSDYRTYIIQAGVV